MNKKAFTLAEILVTLGIIGVIASMTIPNLVQDIQDAQLKTAWKKSYSDLNQAVKRLAMDNSYNLSGVFGNDVNDHNSFRNPFLTYLNYTKLCNNTTALGLDGCWPSTMYKFSGQAVPSSPYARLVLNNGNLVWFHFISINCTQITTPNNDNCGNVLVDVNGFKGPNKIGKDIFGFRVSKTGIAIPFGTQGDNNYNNPLTEACNTADSNTSGYSCSADYLYQ